MRDLHWGKVQFVGPVLKNPRHYTKCIVISPTELQKRFETPPIWRVIPAAWGRSFGPPITDHYEIEQVSIRYSATVDSTH
jgi:hypothetical protein